MWGAQIFTESLTHTATEWTDTRHARVALFTCYDTVNAMYAPSHPYCGHPGSAVLDLLFARAIVT